MSNKNIVKQKKDTREFYNSKLTPTILSKKNRIPELIDLVNYYEIKRNGLFKRIFSYFYNYPKLISYINDNFNNLYKFESYDLYDLLNSLYIILSNNNITSNKIPYIKSNKNHDSNKETILSLFTDFYKFKYNRILNQLELNLLYDLYLNNILDNNDIKQIDEFINGKDSNKLKDIELIENKNNNINNKKDNTIIIENKSKLLSKEVLDLIINIKNNKLNNDNCKKCKLFSNENIILDTNVNNINNNIDILFINLNSIKDDSVFNKPLTDNNFGNLFRNKLVNNIPKEYNWLILNLIPCFIHDKRILNTQKSIKQKIIDCSDILTPLYEKIKPSIIIPLGKPAMEYCNINGTIIQNSGTIIDLGEGVNCIPLISPYALLSKDKSEDNLKAWDFGWESIKSHLNKNKKVTSFENKTSIKKEIKNTTVFDGSRFQKYIKNIPQDKLIKQIDNTLTFFDINELDEECVVLIFIDTNGIKKYLFLPFEYEFFIKPGEFSNCNYLIDKNEELISVKITNSRDLHKIREVFKDNIHTIKNSIK